MHSCKPVNPDDVVLFVKSYYHRGLRRRIFAWQYGLKAFRLVIPRHRLRR